MVTKVQRVSVVQQDNRVLQAAPGRRVQSDRLDHRDLRETGAQLELQVFKGLLAQLVTLDHLDLLDHQDFQETLDLLDSRDLLDLTELLV